MIGSPLQCVQAPYGRYQPGSSPAWGFRMDGRLAWVVQECPCFFFAVWMWATADSKVFGAPNKLLLGLYLLHYSHRTWVFPIRMRGGKPTPFLVFLLAFGFCLVNGFLQSRFLTAYAVFPPNWENNPQFMVGVAIFFAGMYINIDSDVSRANATGSGGLTTAVASEHLSTDPSPMFHCCCYRSPSFGTCVKVRRTRDTTFPG